MLYLHGRYCCSLEILLFFFFSRSGPGSLISNSYSSRSVSLKSRIIGPFPQDSGLLGVVSTLGL